MYAHIRLLRIISSVVLIAGCAHHNAPKAEPTPAVSRTQSIEQRWKAQAQSRHVGFVPKHRFEVYAVVKEPTDGFVQLCLTDADRERLFIKDETIYISKKPLVDQNSIFGALAISSTDNYDWQPVQVSPKWNPSGRKRWKEITGAFVDKYAAVFLDGKPICIPKVMDPIDSPEIQIPAIFSEKELSSFLREFNPPVDFAALTDMRNRCRQGITKTCLLLGSESILARDLPRDPAMAYEMFQAACQQGNRIAKGHSPTAEPSDCGTN